MTTAPQKSDRWIVLSILILASAVFSAVLFYARRTGMLCLDDAYITFRYAENLASRKGFVYNAGEHILGTTTPFFCLLLAGLRMIGIKIPVAADLINLFSAIFSSIVIFLLGRQAKNRTAGLNASLMFICFPYFWLNLPSGMETMFTIFLALVLVLLDLKERPVLAGLVAGLLLLTRIDALALLAGVALMRFFQNRKQAIILVSICLLTLLPWLIFSQLYFGSIIPQSRQHKTKKRSGAPEHALPGIKNQSPGQSQILSIAESDISVIKAEHPGLARIQEDAGKNRSS